MSYKRHDLRTNEIKDLRRPFRMVESRSPIRDADAAAQHARFRIVKTKNHRAKSSQRV
jgi:hypothetical protein